MSVEQKAKELAEAVKETTEYKDLNSAHAGLKLDPAAQDLVTKLQRLQEDVYRTQMQGNAVDDAKINEIKALHDIAEKNETLKRLFTCQENFNNLMQSINEKISKELYAT